MVKWKNGTLVSPAHANEDGTITPAVYEGETPLSAYNLNLMQNEIISVLQQIETPTPLTGENITLNDSKAGKFKSFKIRGNSEQKLGSRNICPSKFNYWESGFYDASDGHKATNAARIRMANPLEIKPATTYYATTFTNDYYLMFRETDENMNILKTINVRTEHAFTTSANAKYLLPFILDYQATTTPTFNIYQNLFANGTLKPFICLNFETDKSFDEFAPEEPSPDYEAPIKSCENSINIRTSNENMFYPEMFADNYTNKNIVLRTLVETNKVVLNGTSNGRFIFYTKFLPLNMFKVGQKYKLLHNYSQNAFFEVFKDGSSDAFLWENEFVMQKNYTKIRAYLQQKGSVETVTFNNQIVSLQIEEGDATTIVEHKGQAYTVPVQKPFKSIGDIRDHFIKENGKYYEKHLIGKYIFKGTETISLENSAKRIYLRFSTNNLANPPKQFVSDKQKYGLLCNYLQEVTPFETWQGIQGISYAVNSAILATTNGFCISINKFTTADQYKSWFAEKYAAGNPFYVDYILAEPELIECTSAQTAVLQDIEDNLKTYDDCTHIYSTDEVAPNMSATYCKDIQKLFNNIAI